MQPKDKTIILAAIICTAPYPTHEAVQALRKIKHLTLPKALQSLMPIHGMSHLGIARVLVKKLGAMTDAQIEKEYAKAVELWRPYPKGTQFGDDNKQRVDFDREQLIVKINALRKHQGLAPLDPARVKDTKRDLEKRIKKLEAAIEQEKKQMARRAKKLAPGVAEGAYRSEREAQHRTGIQSTGPAKTYNLKASDLKGRPTVGGKALPPSKIAKRKAVDGEVTLSMIAGDLNMAPKHARVIARKNKAAIAKLQVAGKKYVFPVKNQSAIEKILRG